MSRPVLQAYKNDPELKAAFLREMRWHEAQDKFVSGYYGSGEGDQFTGCGIGCSVNSLARMLTIDGKVTIGRYRIVGTARRVA